MKEYVPKNVYQKMIPLEQNKRGYGIVKLHKNGSPIRPIVSTIGSLTSGSEEYLFSVLSQFNDICTYSCKSTKEFKNFFLEKRSKFDHNIHEIASLDAVSLFPNVNVQTVIDFIISKIYECPEQYFTYSNDPNQIPKIDYPPEKVYGKNFIEV